MNLEDDYKCLRSQAEASTLRKSSREIQKAVPLSYIHKLLASIARIATVYDANLSCRSAGCTCRQIPYLKHPQA